MVAAAISQMVAGRTTRIVDVTTSRMDNGLFSRIAVATISRMYADVISIAVDAAVVNEPFMLVRRPSSGGNSAKQEIAWRVE